MTREEGSAMCVLCGAEYPAILVSESIPFDEDLATEMSISMDCILLRPKQERVVPFEIESPLEELIVV